MESLQLAQMLADLSDLSAAQESEAAVALVTANKTLAPVMPGQPTTSGTKPVEQRHHQRVASSSGIISRTASPVRFDKFGRRILTPPMTRSNSAQGSIPGTPRRESEHHPDDDVDRATSLMALYEIREKLKQQDNNPGIARARREIIALEARRAAQTAAAGGDKKDATQVHHTRFTYPKSQTTPSTSS